jgi:hypothetical protein
MSSFRPFKLPRWSWLEGMAALGQEERLAVFFLSLYAGAYAFLVLVAAFLPGGHTEREESILFVLGWIVVPAVSLLSALVWMWRRRQYTGDVAYPLRALLGLNSLLFVVVTTGLNLIAHLVGSAWALSSPLYAAVILIPLINAEAALVLRYWGRGQGLPWGWALPLIGGLGLLNFVGFFPYFFGQYSTPLYLLAPAVLVGLGSLFLHWPKRLHVRSDVLPLVVDVLIIVLIILACFDPTFQIATDHQSFYLGPTNRILHGGTMLVDTFCQYGVLVIYFLAALIRAGLIPLTYHGLSLAIAVLMMLQFVLVYLLLRALLCRRLYAILLIALCLLLSLFGTLGTAQAYPSIGPLRFGLAYALLSIVFLRDQYPRLRRAGRILELALVGIASLWSVETLIYALFAYVGICVFESFQAADAVGQSLRRLLGRLALLALALAASQAAFAGWTYQRTGTWPQWGVYLGFISTYTVGGLGAELIEPWSPWIFPIGIYFASLMVFAFRYFVRGKVGDSPQEKLIFGLTLFGIAQYTYYVDRSHPNALYHIAIPGVMIGGYWLVRLMGSDDLPVAVRRGARFSFFAAIALIAVATFPSFSAKYQQNQTGFRIAWRSVLSVLGRGTAQRFWAGEIKLVFSPSPDPQVPEAVALLEKYTPGQTDATVLLSSATTTEVLMASGRVHHFPINDVVEDWVSPAVMTRILESPTGLHPNDVILLVDDPVFYRDQAYGELELGLVAKICREFTLQELDRTAHGVAAFRLQPANGQTSFYCGRIQSFMQRPGS